MTYFLLRNTKYIFNCFCPFSESHWVTKQHWIPLTSLSGKKEWRNVSNDNIEMLTEMHFFGGELSL